LTTQRWSSETPSCFASALPISTEILDRHPRLLANGSALGCAQERERAAYANCFQRARCSNIGRTEQNQQAPP